jgi:hypothetical protein
MAADALRVSSLRGLFADRVKADEIKSRADARKKWPFVDGQGRLLLWVRASWSDGRRKRRAHFRHYPRMMGGAKQFSRLIATEIDQALARKSESELHKTAKQKLASCLQEMIHMRKSLPWHYNDPEASDFSLSGNLLSEVVDIAIDTHQIELPFGKIYRPDIALLGPTLKSRPLLLGIIELELSHEAEGLKCLYCKATAAPVLVVDLQDTNVADITEAWCIERLVQTTATSGDRRRHNYIFLHNMLYPVFSDTPSELLYGDDHQFLVFITDKNFEKLHKMVRLLQQVLELSDSDVRIQPVRLNPTQASSLKMFENEGSIAGPEWRDYNDHRYLRIVLKRARERRGAVYKFHIALANLLTLHFDCLVGYKIARGEYNAQTDSPVWLRKKWLPQEEKFVTYRLLPKRVSEPVYRIAKILEAARTPQHVQNPSFNGTEANSM